VRRRLVAWPPRAVVLDVSGSGGTRVGHGAARRIGDRAGGARRALVVPVPGPLRAGGGIPPFRRGASPADPLEPSPCAANEKPRRRPVRARRGAAAGASLAMQNVKDRPATVARSDRPPHPSDADATVRAARARRRAARASPSFRRRKGKARCAAAPLPRALGRRRRLASRRVAPPPWTARSHEDPTTTPDDGARFYLRPATMGCGLPPRPPSGFR
jgi:hypothetical protein